MPDRKPKVVVTRKLPAPIEARMGELFDATLNPDDRPMSLEALAEAMETADVLAPTVTDRIDARLIERAGERLKLIANVGAGVDHIDVEAASARGITVTNTPGVLTETTADMAFALLLAAARRLPEAERAVRDGAWGPWHPTWLLGREVSGSTLGIIGAGRIGAAVARRAAGFGMRVFYYSRAVHPDFPGEYAGLDALLSESHFVSVHVPLTPETERMCNADWFAKMRPDAVFVNTSRGGVVDQQALRAALERGTIAAAALDVTTPEPLPPDDPLLRAPNLVVVPHLGSATERTRTAMAALAVDNLLAALAGERPQNLVNAEAWERR